MNTPIDGMIKFIRTPEHIQLRRMLITEILITQDSSPFILYKIPFELTKAPSKVWKEILLDTWYCITTQHQKRYSGTVLWVFHNRVQINNVSIELFENELESLLATAVKQTNNQMAMRSELIT